MTEQSFAGGSKNSLHAAAASFSLSPDGNLNPNLKAGKSGTSGTGSNVALACLTGTPQLRCSLQPEAVQGGSGSYTLQEAGVHSACPPVPIFRPSSINSRHLSRISS